MAFVVKVGQYYYVRFRGKFRIYRKGKSESGLDDEYYADCFTKEEASKKVKELNNW